MEQDGREPASSAICFTLMSKKTNETNQLCAIYIDRGNKYNFLVLPEKIV